MPVKTQKDIIEEEVMKKQRVRTEKLILPGIETLHLRPKDELAEILTNVLKSRSGIISMNYVIGKYIELTFE